MWVYHCLEGDNDSWGGRSQRKRALMQNSLPGLTCFVHKIDFHEIFEFTHLKFTVYGRKQARKHTSVMNVGLAQAHPNKIQPVAKDSWIIIQGLTEDSQGYKVLYRLVGRVMASIKWLPTVSLVCMGQGLQEDSEPRNIAQLKQHT